MRPKPHGLYDLAFEREPFGMGRDADRGIDADLRDAENRLLTRGDHQPNGGR